MGLKKRSKKLVFLGLGLAIILVIIVINVTKSGNNQTVVQADLAFTDDIFEKVTASGRIQPQTKVDIASEVSAQIVELYVAEGDRVTKGRHLLLLDTIQYKSDVAQARFSLDEITARAAAARTQFEKDKLENERQNRLFKQQLTSETAATNAGFAFENSQANYDAMLAQVKNAEARLDKAEDNLTKTRITAPMDGVITYLNAEVGEIAQAQTSFTQGKTLMTIADLSVFEVEVDVDETEIAKVQIDHPAEIRVDAFRDTTFAGSVIEIGNSAIVEGQGTDNYTTSFLVKVRFDETEATVRPGMSATVDITTATVEDALLIPYASVVTREVDPDSAKTKEDIMDSTATPGEAYAAGNETVAAGGGPRDDTTGAEDQEKRGRKKPKKIKKSGVFVVQNGVAKFIELGTGIADEQNIVALSGLNPGDTVISGSFQTLRNLSDGDVIKIEERSLTKMREDED